MLPEDSTPSYGNSGWKKHLMNLFNKLAAPTTFFFGTSSAHSVDEEPIINADVVTPVSDSASDSVSDVIDSVRKGLPSDVQLPSFEKIALDLGPLKDLRIDVPQTSQFLRTTTRSFESASSDAVDKSRELLQRLANLHFKLPDLDLEHPSIANVQIPDLSHLDWSVVAYDWRVWAGLAATVIFADTVQFGKDMARHSKEQQNRVQDLTQRLNSAANETENFLALQQESVKLQQEIDSISQQFMQKCQEVDALNETLAVLAVEANQFAAVGAGGGGGLPYSETESLQQTLVDLEAQLADALQEASSARESKETIAALTDAMDKLKQQDMAALSALKSFLLQRGLISDGQANMLVMSSAPDVLQSIVEKQDNPVLGDSQVLNQAKAQVAELEATIVEKDEKFQQAEAMWQEERQSMQAQLDSQQETLDTMQASINALEQQAAASAAIITRLDSSLQKAAESTSMTDAAAPSGNIASAVTAAKLQQQLDAQSAELEVVRKSAQSKLDAAKNMAKDLNSLLRSSEQNFAHREAELVNTIETLQKKVVAQESLPSSAALSAALNAQAAVSMRVPTPSVPGSSSNDLTKKTTQRKAMREEPKSPVAMLAPTMDRDAALSELRGLKGYQIDKKTKSDLQLYLVALGFKTGPDGEPLHSLKKKELAALLKPAVSA